MSTILLTGGTGFIGGAIAERLIADGHRVRCLVRETSETARLRSLGGIGSGVELLVGDLADREALAEAVDGVELVIHGAAMVSDWGTIAEIRAVNTVASADLAVYAARAGVRRFVHLSTTDVYGYPGGREVDEEYASTEFANWYAQTKRDAETLLRRVGEETGLEVVLLRPATVYGPRSRDVVGELAGALKGGYLPLINGGRAIAGLVYVDNVVDAVLAAMTRSLAAGQAFNVTDRLDTTWAAFLGDMAAGLGCRPPRLALPYPVALSLGIGLEETYRRVRGLTGLRTTPLLSRQAVQVLALDQDFSNAKARAVLGWRPRVSYEHGLAATLDWLVQDHFA